MPITPNQRAGHTIRVKVPALADAVVDAHYRLRPELEGRYGERGRRYCREDAEFHLHFLATAVELGDVKVFADYVALVTELLERRGIPARDVADNLGVLERVLNDALPPDLATLIRPAFEAAARQGR